MGQVVQVTQPSIQSTLSFRVKKMFLLLFSEIIIVAACNKLPRATYDCRNVFAICKNSEFHPFALLLLFYLYTLISTNLCIT